MPAVVGYSSVVEYFFVQSSARAGVPLCTLQGYRVLLGSRAARLAVCSRICFAGNEVAHYFVCPAPKV